MITEKLTKDGIEVKSLTDGSNKLVKAVCDKCGHFLGSKKSDNWIRYKKISKKEHICKSCSARKSKGFNNPVNKEIDGKKLRYCNSCEEYRPQEEFYERRKNVCKKCSSEDFKNRYNKKISRMKELSGLK